MAIYFSHIIPIERRFWQQLELDECARIVTIKNLPEVVFFRQLADELRNKEHLSVTAGQLGLYGTLLNFYRFLIDSVANKNNLLAQNISASANNNGVPSPETTKLLKSFVNHFPSTSPTSPDNFVFEPANNTHTNILLREMLLLSLSSENRALDNFRTLFDDSLFIDEFPEYPLFKKTLHNSLENVGELCGIAPSLLHALYIPLLKSPDSLKGQLEIVRKIFGAILPKSLLEQIESTFGTIKEEERFWGGAGGEPPTPPVMEFGLQSSVTQTVHDGASVFGGYDYPEHEAFSTDAHWMPNVVLLAKMVYVWLDQLSRQYGYTITRLDQIPESELETISKRGFTGLWLIGIWERSAASQRIKELCGNPDAIASAYSLYDYEIAVDLGGWEALSNLRKRALNHGIRLASDMVPNHTGIYSRWVLHHPDWFVQTDYPPFPTYRFSGENLSRSENAVIQIEDGYWTKTDAAVVFRMIEHSTGRTRYIYHGNDGTTIPWNDTAQLNYLLPEVREAVIQTILHVARNFPIIRFDAAMTLAKKHYQRLWYPIPGLGGGIASRAEHGMNRDEFDSMFPAEFWREVVDRVSVEAPGTLLLAEAFWLMEGYFVRTLGMHRVYNSAFMNMLMKEENEKYRRTIKNVLAFNPEVLQRFVNFMNNPDEKTAVAQFGSEGKYFGCCLLLATMPGLPMFGHGQVEGFHEKYGMEYKRAYWDEPVDKGLVQGHEQWIFPILRKRAIFSGAINFALYDFVTANGTDENVYAYSNRSGEERAVVIYNNSYSKTAGWIRQSSPIAITGGENPQLSTVTIADALALKNDQDLYYAFHDHTRNAEYIRSSSQLNDEGIYGELAEYEFHIFSNFRQLWNDSSEPVSWGQLCVYLSGRGVENLDDELKQLRYYALNSAVRKLLVICDDLSDKIFPDALADFQLEISKHTNIKAPLYKVTNFIATLNKLELAITMFSKAGYDLRMSMSDRKKFLPVFLLMLKLPAHTVSKFGFDCTLQKSLECSQWNSVAILNILLTIFNSEKPIKKCSTPHILEKVATLFTESRSSIFMQVHRSAGIEWFNKEAFEELLLWIFIAHAIFETKQVLASKKADSVICNEFLYEWLCQMAKDAGYRAALFLELIKNEHLIKKTTKGIQRIKKDATIQK